MENIIIYNPENMERKNIIPSRRNNSVIWNLRFYEAGSFQFKLTDDVFEIGDIVRQGEKAGIVLKIVKNLYDIDVYGYTLDAITKFRHIYESSTYSGTPEYILTEIAKKIFTNGDRTIPALSVETGHTECSDEYEVKFENQNVYDTLESFCKTSEVSYDICFKGESLVFKSMQGRHMEDYIKFSRRLGNVEDLNYTVDDYDSKNVVYTSREEYDEWTDTTSTKYYEIGSALGFARHETGSQNYDEAQTIIDQNQTIETLKGTANDRLVYGKDWFLGDYVTVVFRGLITTKQIVEVEMTYEKGNTTIIPIFGTEKENPIKKLMRL